MLVAGLAAALTKVAEEREEVSPPQVADVGVGLPTMTFVSPVATAMREAPLSESLACDLREGSAVFSNSW